MPEMINESGGGSGGNEVSLVPQQKLSENYDALSSRVRQLIQSWDIETKATEYRRRARNLSVNVQDLRSKNQLKMDETFIPIRLIDTTIKREQPARIAFLKQSPRLAIFKNPLAPSENNDVIESEFTRVNQYQGWELPFFKCDDGAATHGWDAMELELDYDNPGGFRWDHVGHDCLIFALDSGKFQANEIVIRIIPVTVEQLRRFVSEFGFKQEECEKVVQQTERSSNQPTNDSVPQADSQRLIYKVFFREDGMVKVAWWAKEATSCLKDPKPLFLGVVNEEEQSTVITVGNDPLSGQPIQDMVPQMVQVKEYEKDFPFVLQFYEETEQRRIRDHKGRVFKDDYKQEASCAIWSSFVNGCLRATQVMASPKNPVSGGAPKQNQNFVPETGKIWTEPMDFFNMPYPSPELLNAAQKLDVQHSEETNQVNFAVRNNKDSRKTAEEIRAASSEQALINGVNVTMYSVFIRECCQRSWRLVSSFAKQGKIMFVCLGLDPDTKQPINNVPIIDQPWELFAAGDTDVVQRAEKVQRQLSLWPIIAETPLAMTFLIDILKNTFPDDSARYEKELREFQQMQQQVTLMKNLQAAQIGQSAGQSQPQQTETTNQSA